MYDIFIMDMGGHDDNVQNLQTRFPHSRVVRYYDNHLDTLKRCVSRSRTPFCWVISSCCDYTAFNFDYKAVPWESTQLHCWHSGYEKFGDTFLINIKEFELQKDIPLLEWYKDVNYHYPGVPRLPWPILETATEDVTSEIKKYNFTAPYVWINQQIDFHAPLWRDRVFYSFNTSGSVSLAPRDITAHLDRQIYDYPHVLKQKQDYLTPTLLDIIYISNGEPEAERWYEHLVKTCGREVKRVKDVTGRALAYKAAAELSSTPWFFTVFAKLEVVEDFDWTWQPDCLQEPKHYIFNSRNAVNGLEYGHMGVIAYNKQLVLDTHVWGLDFTLSKPHAVVPKLSAIAHYNTTPELTWRTAFREVLKLKDDIVKTGSVESQYRLEVWMSEATGDHSMWSLLGAKDAIEYYALAQTHEFKDDFLLLSFEWKWLSDYYAKIYTPKANRGFVEPLQQPVQLLDPSILDKLED